jgi:predicted transcriptional regulator
VIDPQGLLLPFLEQTFFYVLSVLFGIPEGFSLERRTRYEIFADLLDIVVKRELCAVTRASYGANLPVDRAKKFLTFLASRGFVKEEFVGDSKKYRITKRGLEYLETYQKMQKMFAALAEKLPE